MTLLDKVKRNAFFIAAAFFLWQGWASANAAPEVDAELDAEPAAIVKVPSIRADFLRGPTESDAAAPSDPYGMLEKALAKQARLLAEMEESGELLDPTLEPTAKRPKFVLQLENTMHANHVWVARINGHSLRVGESLPGFDENQPPVLVSVQGTVAELRYDGKLITLDLSGQASVSVN